MTDYNAPLRWEHEDGRTGMEVRDVPHSGRVFFFDEDGPLARFDDVAEARWWVLRKIALATGREQFFRVTRLVDGEGGKHYIVPGRMGLVDCDETHNCHGKHPCVVTDDLVNDLFQAGA